MRAQPNQRDQPGLSNRARLAIGLCVALPMVLGILITAGTFHSAPAAPQQLFGHWVYVPSTGTAVQVDGDRVDAQVNVGSASTGSQVVADQHAAYLVDYDHVVMFTPTGVTGSAPAAGVAENPVPLAAGGTAYLVYRTSGLIVRLGPHPFTIPAGGPLGVPVATPTGALWVNRVDTGAICQVGPTTLTCPTKAPPGRIGALTTLNGAPAFVDLTAGTWQPVTGAGLGRPTRLGVSLPADAEVGSTPVAGQIPIIDPDSLHLYLISAGSSVTTVPLGSGHFSAPVSTADATAVLDTDTGTVTSYTATGARRASIPVAGGAVTLAPGNDGRVYADSLDGLQTVVMAVNGGLTLVRTTNRTPPSYQTPAPVAAISLPPATVVQATTESVPPAPNTVTVDPTPATSGVGSPPGSDTDPSATTTRKPTKTSPPPGPPPGSPVVDVLSATATGPDQATLQIRVTGEGPVFCHVFFDSVERAGTACGGTMQVVVTDLPEHTLFDVYVIGTNTKGTGNPGRRATLQN
jgi:hypothetical protein